MSELNWKEKEVEGRGTYHEAIVGDFANKDGVRFSLQVLPTCQIRGPFMLLVEVADKGYKWPGFDEMDQPLRYYQDLQHALAEAELIAQVLVKGRKRNE
jgi:hypothetical protein